MYNYLLSIGKIAYSETMFFVQPRNIFIYYQYMTFISSQATPYRDKVTEDHTLRYGLTDCSIIRI